jgi:hypothetical protein
MPEATTADSLRQRWQGLFEVFQAPPPDPSLFRQRIRFVERNIGIWVKLVLAPVIYWFLFNPNAFGGISVPREDVLSYLQTLSGKPLIKPLFFLNETDSNLYKAEDQYLWGDKVMIVPITNKSEKIKTYYIPEGKWTNIYDYREFDGPRWITDSSISIAHIPVYAMEGSFIPQASGMISTADYDKASFSVLFFPSSKNSEYLWYEDDGTDPAAIKNKNYRITHFSATPKYNGTEIVITREGNYNINVPREIMLVIPAQGIPKGVRMNNKLFKTDRLFAGNFLRIPVLLNKASTEIFISW